MNIISALPILWLFTPMGFLLSLMLCNVVAFDFRDKCGISLSNKPYCAEDYKIISYLFIFGIVFSFIWQILGSSHAVTNAFLLASIVIGVVSVINGYKAFKAVLNAYTGRSYLYSCFVLLFVYLVSWGVLAVFFIFAYALLKWKFGLV